MDRDRLGAGPGWMWISCGMTIGKLWETLGKWRFIAVYCGFNVVFDVVFDHQSMMGSYSG